MLNRICRRIEEEGRRYPLAAVDKRLFDLLDCRFYWSDLPKVRAVSDAVEGRASELRESLLDWFVVDSSISDREKVQKYSACSAWLWERDASFDVHWRAQKPVELEWWIHKQECRRSANG